MENYHKRPKTKRSRFESDDEVPAGGATSGAKHGRGDGKTKSDVANNTNRHGVMHISAHGKIRTYVSRGLEVLLENEASTAPDLDSNTTTPKAEPAPSSSTSTASATEPTKRNFSGSPGVLTIKAQGKNIPKAVTIAEILKRKLEGSLHQFTEIGQVTEEEVWDPNSTATTASSSTSKLQQQLDPIRLLRHRPTIRIRLSKHLDTQNLQQADKDSEDENDEEENATMERWPGAILERDAAVRRLVGYQAPTGNDIYL